MMSPEDLACVQARLESVASSRRHKLPTQDAITEDLQALATALEDVVAELKPQANGDYSVADIWYCVQLIACKKVEINDI